MVRAPPRWTMLKLKRLTVRREGAAYLVGDPETGNFIQLEAEGYRILRALQRKSIPAVEHQFPAVNLPQFIGELRANGFIANHRQLHRRSYVPSRIAQRHVAWLLSWPVLVILLALIGIALYAVLRNPALLPDAGDFFFSESAWLLPLSFALGWLLICIHEFAHYLAAVASGISARFGISTQLLSITAVTDLSNLYTLPPRKRYPVILAGMAMDAFLCASAILAIQFLGSGFNPPWIIPLLKMVALLEFLGIAWELQFFMETDPYYALETLFSVHNLHAQGLGMLSAVVRGNFRTLRGMRWVYPLYALLMAGGAVVLAWQFVTYTIPILKQLFLNAFAQLYASLQTGVTHGAAIVNLMVIGASALLYAIGLLHHYSRTNHPLRFTFLYSLLASVINGLLFLIAVAVIPFGGIPAALVCFAAAFGFGLLLAYELDQEFSRVNAAFLLMLGLPVLLVTLSVQYKFAVVLLQSTPVVPLVAIAAGLFAAFLQFVPLAERFLYCVKKDTLS